MVIVLSGSNDFSRKAELDKLVSTFVAQYGDFGMEKIEAGNVEFGRIIESVSSLPFLAERRMIILLDASQNKVLAETIEQLLNAVAETTDLVIDERKFDKRMSLYKTLKKRTDFKEFNELDERGLAAWLVSEARSRGGELKQSDAVYLVQRAGLNQMGLSNELDKLITYEPKIERKNIDLLIEPLPQSSVFDLLDAAFAGDRKRAMELYQEQRKQQVEPQAIMGMLAWQLHILAVVKFNEKTPVDELARAAKINPYVVRKTQNLTHHLTQAEVRDLISRALELDVRLKSENIDADDAVQHFLLTI
jgi:DNA polymerase-3 subunit delta